MGKEQDFQSRYGLTILFVSCLSMWTTLMAIFPMVPNLTGIFSVTPEKIGQVLGLSSLIMILFNIPAGVFSDSNGRKPFILAGLFIVAITSFFAVFAHNFIIFACAWLVGGIGRGLFLAPAFAIIGDVFQPNNRGKAMSVLASSLGIGSVVGYLLGGVVGGIFGWKVLFFLLGVLNLVAFTLSLFLMETCNMTNPRILGNFLISSFSWFKKPTISLLAFITTIGFTSAVAVTFLIPFAAKNAHISLVWLSTFFIPYEVIGILGTLVMGRISDKIGRRLPLTISIASGIIGVFLLILFGTSFSNIMTSYAIVGLCEGTLIGLSTTMVIDIVVKKDPSQIGGAMSSFRSVYTMGAVLGPWLAGLLISHISLTWSFTIILVALILILFASFFTTETLQESADNRR